MQCPFVKAHFSTLQLSLSGGVYAATMFWYIFCVDLRLQRGEYMHMKFAGSLKGLVLHVNKFCS